jgi:DNA recombination protein RmuC
VDQTAQWLIVGLLVVAVVLLAVVLLRTQRGGSAGLERRLDRLDQTQSGVERRLREELVLSRQEASTSAKGQREELAGGLRDLSGTLVGSVSELGRLQENRLQSVAQQLGELTSSSERHLAALRDTVDERLRLLQRENSQKLDEMRLTVDQQLQGTLEKRLGESFRQVSEHLEAVHKGLGEMQSLAAGVGDLKRVLSNVKARGVWGEVQLSALLEQVLTPEQYSANVAVRKGSQERVEFAVRLPGRDGGVDDVVWLPIDAKFPLEDYQRLLDAQERGDVGAVEASGRQLETRIRQSARDIQSKYVDPPATTDFAIMFLPTEGLYAEVLRRPGLAEVLQCEFRVTVAGPSNLAALLNSLQMGFRTLAIERRSSEVWQILGAVKTQFGQFGDTLEKVQTKLRQASTTIDDATRKTRTIERRLRDVEELPSERAREMLGSAPEVTASEPDGDASAASQETDE